MIWRFTLINPADEPRLFALPCFMSGGVDHANAKEATEAWTTLFSDAHRGAFRHYEESGPMEVGTTIFTGFILCGTWMAATDSGTFHDSTLMPRIFTIVSCRDQEEIDRYWAGLSVVSEAGHCSWCVDR